MCFRFDIHSILQRKVERCAISSEVFLRDLPFCRYNALIDVTHPIFEISTTVLTRLTDAFHHLVPKDNFHCQTPMKSNAIWQIWLQIEIS